MFIITHDLEAALICDKTAILREGKPIKNLLRAGNEIVEILMEDFEENLPKLIQFLINNGIKINSMSRDIATFRRYFQIRIQEEESKEKEYKDKEGLFGDENLLES